jgi:signal transduction histidine kinase
MHQVGPVMSRIAAVERQDQRLSALGYELLFALDELGVNDGWRMTEPLARAGVDADWLRAVASAAGARAQPVIGALADAMAASALACELRDASHRMSYLVDVMKTYTYMDRGSLLDVDVHEGLEATVAMLRYRLEPARIQVVRDFATDVPRIRTHGPDLNQAWMNLINNAIDAVGDGGSITLRTRRDGGAVRVEIIDDGPGIPVEVRDQVFDWFFTTRGVGEGAGLGLPAARQIVKAHDGDIAIESRLGLTIATVWLPAQP